MSKADRVKWDARYAARADQAGSQASKFLRDHLHLATQGPALDAACGRGRNAVLLAAQGFQVDAVDISAVGLAHARWAADEAGLEINWLCQDLLEAPEIPRADYQLIIMIHFVAFDLLEVFADSLAPGGVLMVEEHLRWPAPVSGPGSDRFRVAPGQLAAAVPGLEKIVYREGLVPANDGADAALAQLIARKRL